MSAESELVDWIKSVIPTPITSADYIYEKLIRDLKYELEEKYFDEGYAEGVKDGERNRSSDYDEGWDDGFDEGLRQGRGGSGV